MTSINPPDPNPELRPPTHWPSVLQFALSALGVLGAWGVALLFLFALLLELFSPAGTPLAQTSIGIYLANGILIGFLLLPSAVFSFARVIGRPIKPGETWQTIRRMVHPKKLIMLFPFLVLAGYLINRVEIAAWLLLPPVNLLALSIPVVWLVWLAVRRVFEGSHQLTWGIFSSGLVLGPVIIIVLEIITMLVFGVVFLLTQPDLYDFLSQFASQFQTGELSGELDPALLADLTANPAVLFAFLIFLSVLVPLIEEAIKPIGVWLLAGRDLSPQMGFTAGILSGAGFALFENLGLAAPGGEWTVLMIGRLGTTVLHIFNTGLIGYTLALAWKEHRYLQLAGAYFLTVVLHGLWNGLTLVGVFAGLGEEALLPASLAPVSGIALAILAVSIFVMLVRMNRKLSAQDLSAVQTDK